MNTSTGVIKKNKKTIKQQIMKVIYGLLGTLVKMHRTTRCKNSGTTQENLF